MILSLIFVLTATILLTSLKINHQRYNYEVKNIFSAISSSKEAVINIILGYTISKFKVYSRKGVKIDPKVTFVSAGRVLRSY